jgi:hypothetical protein
MPKTNLGSMSVEQLLQLRDDVGKELNRKSTELRSSRAAESAEYAWAYSNGQVARLRDRVLVSLQERSKCCDKLCIGLVQSNVRPQICGRRLVVPERVMPSKVK